MPLGNGYRGFADVGAAPYGVAEVNEPAPRREVLIPVDEPDGVLADPDDVVRTELGVADDLPTLGRASSWFSSVIPVLLRAAKGSRASQRFYFGPPAAPSAVHPQTSATLTAVSDPGGRKRNGMSRRDAQRQFDLSCVIKP
jgi:hypothetical protein